MNCAITKLSIAPRNAHIAINFGGATRSGKFSTALTSAPTTNPSCTLIVSHAAAPSDRFHATFSAGATALAENHSPIASNSTSANNPSCVQREDSFDDDVMP